MERGDLVRVTRPDRPVRYGVVLKTRQKVVENPKPREPRVYVQALVHYDEGDRSWTATRYVFLDRQK